MSFRQACVTPDLSLAAIERALPHLIVKRDEAVFDQERGALAGVRRTRLATPGGSGLIIEEKAGIAVSPEAAARALADVIGADLARHLRLDDTARQVRDRLAFAALHLRTDALPTGSDDELRALLPEVCQGKRTIAEVQRTPWAHWRAASSSCVLARMLSSTVELCASVTWPSAA